MNTQLAVTKRLKGLLAATFLALLMSLGYLGVYFNFSSERFHYSSVLFALLIILIAVFISLNFFYFHAKMVKARPKIARVLPFYFALASVLVFFTCKLFFNYTLTPQRVVLGFLFTAIVWFLLNLTIFCITRKPAAQQ